MTERNGQATPAGELSEYYYDQADRLEVRLKELRARVKEKPPAEELASLELRIDTLRYEIRDLRETALKLRRIASPAPLTPSLAAREREAS